MPEPVVEEGVSMLQDLTTVVTSLINNIISVWSSIVSESSIMPYFLLGIGISLVLVAVKIIRSVVWGA